MAKARAAFALFLLALPGLALAQPSREALDEARRTGAASRAAAEQARVRYREGEVDFLVLLDAERERLSAEDAQAQAEVELYRGIVAIYKALGGGWQPNA